MTPPWFKPLTGSTSSTSAPDSAIGVYDAQDLTLNDKDTVSTWTDQSDANNDLTAGTAPTYRDSIINGKPAVRFDGADDILDVSWAAESQPNRVYIVFRVENFDGSGDDDYFFGSDDSNNRNDLYITYGSPEGYNMYAGSTLNPSSDLDANIHVATVEFDGTNSFIRVDGTQVESGDAGSQSMSGLTLGARYAGDFHAAIDVAEVVVDPDPGNDISEQESRLTDKWASEYDATKDGANPVLTGTSADSDQTYPPYVIQSPGGTYYAYAKSDGRLYGFSSSDGKSWSSEGIVIDQSGSGWDSDRIGGGAAFYNPGDSTYYILYQGRSGNKDQLGLATSSDPVSNFSKSSSNPLFDPNDAGSKWDRFAINDMVVDGGTHYFYGRLTNTDPSPYELALCVLDGTSWTDVNFNQILYHADDSPHGPSVQGPSVFVDSDGYWRHCFTAGEIATKVGERRLFSGYGTGPTDFTALGDVLLEPGVLDDWDDRRVYRSRWLKKQDGEFKTPLKPNGDFWLYYSGHAAGGGNQGYTGLARYSSLPNPTTLDTL